MDSSTRDGVPEPGRSQPCSSASPKAPSTCASVISPTTRAIEVDTPNVAITLLRPGDYRIDADSDNSTTGVIVRVGDAEITGGGVAFTLHARQSARMQRHGHRHAGSLRRARPRTSSTAGATTRDRREVQSESTRYVPRDMTGYEDLDAIRRLERRRRITVRCGRRARFPSAGLLTATAIGPGSSRGAGPGWTMRRGALRRSTTAAGPTIAAAGSGCPGRWCAECARLRAGAGGLRRRRPVRWRWRFRRLVPARPERSLPSRLPYQRCLRAQRQPRAHQRHQREYRQRALPQSRDRWRSDGRSGSRLSRRTSRSPAK